ncbi:MAG: hypothetical protein ACREQC_08845 [Candidatus Binataceae bacterium]
MEHPRYGALITNSAGFIAQGLRRSADFVRVDIFASRTPKDAMQQARRQAERIYRK